MISKNGELVSDLHDVIAHGVGLRGRGVQDRVVHEVGLGKPAGGAWLGFTGRVWRSKSPACQSIHGCPRHT